MLKKLVIVFAAFVGSISFAQEGGFPYTVDGWLGQRWIGTNEAGWYGGARMYMPVGVDVLGADLYAVPEVGIDYNTLQPYGAVELTVDLDSITLGAFATYIGGVPRINLEARFCVLGPCHR